MANQFTTTTTTGYGNRIMGSIAGIPIGILLIIGSIFLLYWNEGRVDLSKIAKKSVPVSAEQIQSSANGQFVSVTGTADTKQMLGDGAYLRPGPYLGVQRVVEEYAWVQNQQQSSQSNVGGSQTNTTTYTYAQQWTDSVADSSSFKDPNGHQNPPKPLDDSAAQAQTATVGVYTIDPQTIKLPSLPALALTPTDTVLPGAAGAPAATPATAPTTVGTGTTATTPAAASLNNLALASPQYLFSGSGSLSSPQVGDIRISYQALPAGTNVTTFGLLNNGKIDSYTDPQNHTLYLLLLGDRQTAISTLHNQYETLTWILRGVGLVVLWIGLTMLAAPLDVLLDFLPLAGEIGRGLTALITIPLALLIGGTVILVSYTLHHILALLVAVPVAALIGFGIFKLIKQRRGIPRQTQTAGESAPMSAPVSVAGSAASAATSGSLFPSAAPPPPAPNPVAVVPLSAPSPNVAPPPVPPPATPPLVPPVTPPPPVSEEQPPSNAPQL